MWELRNYNIFDVCDQESYRRYRVSRFARVIDKPLLIEFNNKAEALESSRKIWDERFPLEPFDLRVKPWLGSDKSRVHPESVNSESKIEDDDFDLVAAISAQAFLYRQQVPR